MATTNVDIYNLSLFYIGHSRRIESPTESTTENRNCTAIYEQSKRALLTMADWSFAKTSEFLSLTGHSATGWGNEYYYPQGCIKALEIARSSQEQDVIPFQTALRYDQISGEESRVIWTDESSAELVFLRDVLSPAMFTPKFIDTLAYYMGIPLARVMAKNTKTPADMTQMFQYNLSEAIRSGEAEAQDKKELDAEWIRER